MEAERGDSMRAGTLGEVAQRLAEIAESVAAPPAELPDDEASPADRLAYDLLQVVRQQVVGVAHLAQSQPAAQVAALTLARAAFEQALRVLWLLAPDEAAGRSARWAAFLKVEAKHWKRLAKALEAVGQPADRVLARQQGIDALRENLVGGGDRKREKSAKSLPEPRKLLKELGLRGAAVPYLLSDPAVGLTGPAAAPPPAGGDVHADTPLEATWYLPLMLAWLALRGAVARAVEVGAVGNGVWDVARARDLTGKLHALAQRDVGSS